MDEARVDTVIASADECFELLVQLELTTVFMNCSTLAGGAELCCQQYEDLLRGNCWCTVAAVDDSQGLMTDAYFNASICQDIDPKYNARIRGKQCPIPSEHAEVAGLNTVACYWEFDFLFADSSTGNDQAVTAFLSSCSDSAAWNTSECCSMVKPAAVDYQCLCFAPRESGYPLSSDIDLLRNVSMACGYDIEYEASVCGEYSSATYYPVNTEVAAKINVGWNVDVISYQQSLTENSYMGESTLPTAGGDIGESLPTCEKSDPLVPFDCDTYIQAFCNQFNRVIDGTSSCMLPELQYLVCDGDILDKCGSVDLVPRCSAFKRTSVIDYLINYGTADYVNNFGNGENTMTYNLAVTLTLMDLQISPQCVDIDSPTCSDLVATCQADLPAIEDRIYKCAMEPDSTCSQCDYVQDYYPSDMYLCARALFWELNADASNATSCRTVLYGTQQLDHRFNFAVGAFNSTDLKYCWTQNQMHGCSSNDPDPDLTWRRQTALSKIPDHNTSKGCHVHSDCGGDFFCALLATGGDSMTPSSVCMPCAWCSGCYDNYALDYTWALHPVEPTCGHCPCYQECTLGCAADEQYGKSCSTECYTEDCGYSLFQCPYDDTDADTHAATLLQCASGNDLQ
ncbi:hypothetical protein CYMTET_21629, partial [Cymbomonas tetramitiformis]